MFPQFIGVAENYSKHITCYWSEITHHDLNTIVQALWLDPVEIFDLTNRLILFEKRNTNKSKKNV